MAVNIYSTTNMRKVMTNILQGSAVTETTLGGLTIYPPVANVLYSVYMPKVMIVGWQ